MKMITNYLSTLESYLPDHLKQDVREELEASIYASIEDQSEHLGRDLNEKEQAALLANIGHPMRVASSYLPNQQLISSDYFPAYKKSLQIALAIVLGLKLLITTPFIFASSYPIAAAIGAATGFIDTALWVFAVVTLIFYLMQKYGANLDQIYAWSPSDLKEKRAQLSIKRIETVFALIFQSLFIAWWNDILSWPDTNASEPMMSTATFSPEWATVLMTVNVIVALGMVVEFHKLVIAGWHKVTLLANIALSIATLVVLFQINAFETFVVLTDNETGLWNNAITTVDFTIKTILGFIAVVSIWEIYSSVRHLTKK